MIQELHNQSQIQLPVRLDPKLFNELDTMSNQTLIPKSALTRLAIKRLLTDMNNVGAPVIIKSLCEL
jgi:predicted DNA-binding protein